ncbi:hypothetical protein BC835DRAFT_1323219 [Cytidiella melzeri]|nr:hypothetical protein BC835DRAFT_1323219 [Cytidiella melzeri]
MSLSSRMYSGSQIATRASESGSLKLHSPPAGVATSTSTSPHMSPPTSPLKRKHSRISVDTPMRRATDRTDMSPSQTTGRPLPYQLNLSNLPLFSADAVAEPPSPVPTEIIDIEGEDFVRTAKNHGVKVRDYAYEGPKPGVSLAPELWRNTFMSLLSHDMHIRRPSDPNFELSGKLLRRLLDVKLVTEEEAKRHWTPVDWQRLKAYDERPQGAYPYCVAMKRPRPSISYRIAARMQFYGDPLPSDIPDSAIYMPEDGPGMWEGDEDTKELGQMVKKRRLESEERKRNAMKPKVTAVSSVLPPAGPSSQSQSQLCEYSQLSNPIYSTSQDTGEEADLVATPPTTPIALPENRQSLVRSASFTSISTSASPSATSNGSSSRSPRPSRRLGRSETLSLLLVR